VLANLEAEGKIRIVASMYDIASGTVALVWCAARPGAVRCRVPDRASGRDRDLVKREILRVPARKPTTDFHFSW